MAASSLEERKERTALQPANWVVRTSLLWDHRRLLSRVTAIALVLSLGIAFTIPKQYKSTARIMPPDQGGVGGLAMAALASKGGLGGIGGLLGGLLGGHTSTALFVDLLHSGTVTGHLVERFHLQQVYHKRYLVDTAKHLARITTVTDDKKSGVITIVVEDTDPVRARDLAQGYLDELNRIVTRTSTSSAHQERVFIEGRLRSVQSDLEQAQLELSEFSSRNSTIDIKEQTRAMVDAASRVQAEVLVEQSGLNSLRQIYGDNNIRVRETEARINSLQGDLNKMSGTSAPLAAGVALGSQSATDTDGKENALYPPLRQLPRLAVPYADLYRRVRVQEAVFELLTQQYELSRVEEAKDVPVVSVIDPPGIAEKKSSPSRLLVALLLTAFIFAATSTLLILREGWKNLSPDDPRKALALKMLSNMHDANPGARIGGLQ